MRIRISWPNGALTGLLNDSATARQLAEVLPVSSSANTWGDEVYFSVPVETELDAHPKQVVAPGTICFWVQGSSVAIPYGPTPVSVGNECRLVTAVNVIGKLDGDPKTLFSVQDGDTIVLEAENG
ncbi:MAG TPA: cyclophilin-like fold protein [Candidatus Hydrogenedentes bacterium]|nr:cyclophilin-like fold protein [Candidatus Hydrogenedentota bacterium]HQE82574.1 cyclophilin-like fold protein [Candidatus Hydrogenedentota bacterium]HQH51764.1 cyclophilin-like fold protein [Candidatus Hydrogenedentota bacterium]HQM47256.1 cyclophilin-like fold protein [Candidatus Hydrogenedentota bacterium]